MHSIILIRAFSFQTIAGTFLHCVIFFFSTRRARGALNFDDADVGLVSDSMVANSLHLQNGSSPSSSDVLPKTELPEI